MIKHEGGKYNVYDSSGSDRLGSHDTRAEAVNQIQAIEASKDRRKNRHGTHEEWSPYKGGKKKDGGEN